MSDHSNSTRDRLFSAEFYPDRPSLEGAGSLDTLLRSATEINAVLVGGSTLITHRQNARRIRRVIFPDPAGDSLIAYAKTVRDFPTLCSKIPQATDEIQQAGVSVRWYPQMIGHTMLIGDPQLESGWVKFEAVLPFADFTMRPNFIVRSSDHLNFIELVAKTFEEIWKGSGIPSKTTFSALLQKPRLAQPQSDSHLI